MCLLGQILEQGHNLTIGVAPDPAFHVRRFQIQLGPLEPVMCPSHLEGWNELGPFSKNLALPLLSQGLSSLSHITLSFSWTESLPSESSLEDGNAKINFLEKKKNGLSP